MPTAQERFTGLVRSMWGPTLRSLGFQGAGKLWTRPDDDDWIMLGFQTSTSSSADRAKFTINLLVVGKQAWESARHERPWLAARPSPNVGAVHRYWQRSGLLTHGEDHWWSLAADGSDEAHVAAEVDRALRDVLVPALVHESDRTATRRDHQPQGRPRPAKGLGGGWA